LYNFITGASGILFNFSGAARGPNRIPPARADESQIRRKIGVSVRIF
jgi:hypothetical protein